MNSFSFSQLGNTHQYQTVASGETKRIFYLKIPNSCKGFINRWASNYYSGVKWTVKIDGEIIERAVEMQLGDINNPRIIEPEIMVTSNIEIFVENTTSSSLVLEAIVYGLCIHVASTVSSAMGGYDG